MFRAWGKSIAFSILEIWQAWGTNSQTRIQKWLIWALEAQFYLPDTRR
jgi:hypothetical protein